MPISPTWETASVFEGKVPHSLGSHRGAGEAGGAGADVHVSR